MSSSIETRKTTQPVTFTVTITQPLLSEDQSMDLYGEVYDEDTQTAGVALMGDDMLRQVQAALTNLGATVEYKIQN